MDLQKAIEFIKEVTQIKVKELSKDKAVIYLEAYNLEYQLLPYDWYFSETLHIIEDPKTQHYLKNKSYEEYQSLFSSDELLNLRNAIREDVNKCGSLYERYFYQDEKTLKELTKDYVLDYITFIERITN